MHRVVFAFLTLMAALVWADGIPTPDSLVYSGVVLGPGGNPLPGTPAILVALWDAESGGTKRCDSAGQPVRYGGEGRFSVSLSSCTVVVSQNANLFVEVSVTGVPLPRMKIAASPYAVEAHRAASSSRLILDGGVGKTSGVGMVCGLEQNRTGNLTEGGLSGYRAAKAICERVCNSPTAHICTAHEGTLSASFGNPPVGRYSTGVTPNSGGSAIYLTDCDGFTSSSAQRFSAFWPLGSPGPDVTPCSTSTYVSCCD